MIKLLFWMGVVLLYLATIVITAQLMLYIGAPLWFQMIFFGFHGATFGAYLRNQRRKT